jgi:hypothetical protein
MEGGVTRGCEEEVGAVRGGGPRREGGALRAVQSVRVVRVGGKRSDCGLREGGKEEQRGEGVEMGEEWEALGVEGAVVGGGEGELL